MHRQHVTPGRAGNISGFACRLSGSGTRTVCDGHGSCAEFAKQRGSIREPNAADLAGAFNMARREHMIHLAFCSPDDGRYLGHTPQKIWVDRPAFLDGIARIF
jgi:hypothetical protein